MQTAPYGSWVSPITAADLAADRATRWPVAGSSVTRSGGPSCARRGRPAGGAPARSDGEPEDVLPRAVERAHPGARVRRRRLVGHRRRQPWCSPSSPTSGCTGSTPGRPSPVAAHARSRPTPARCATPSRSCAAARCWCVRERHAADGAITRDIARRAAGRIGAEDEPARSARSCRRLALPGRTPGCRRTATGWPGSPGTTRRCPGTAPNCASPSSADDGTLRTAPRPCSARPPSRCCSRSGSTTTTCTRSATAPAGGTCTGSSSTGAQAARSRRRRGGRLRRRRCGARHAAGTRCCRTDGCWPCARSAATRWRVLDPATGAMTDIDLRRR